MNKKYYIVVSGYSLENAKRQPWYTVRHLKDVVLEGCHVEVVSSFSDVTDSADAVVIKFWSIKDLFFSPINEGKIIYLMSFPLYECKDLFARPLKLWQNLKNIWKILLVSMIPKIILLNNLKKADNVIFISDRSYDLIGHKLQDPIMYYPYFKENWGQVSELKEPNLKPSDLSKGISIGYFGPPFTSRGFDDVIRLINNLNNSEQNVHFKLIVRTERFELKKKLDFYRKKIKNIKNVEIISGFLTRELLYQELQEVDVIVLPFSFVFSELPIVVLEAIELNKLVFTTVHSGLNTIVKDAPCCDIVDINSILSESDLMGILQNRVLQDRQQNDALFETVTLTHDTLRNLLCQN